MVEGVGWREGGVEEGRCLQRTVLALKTLVAGEAPHSHHHPVLGLAVTTKGVGVRKTRGVGADPHC